ncbi:SpoVR family protein [Alicyclobacillus cycloheptanicus]|uniref:Stage V sporulation protein R n=1 Tax=Alicyclobacillus cycloheptanicus TaxID=1457 RepID=A0ABT9XK83_9BACL|nr:SpoVR family protein [Alicyclobacillus cycloheptanicus]MDQ0190718.1 stage V sporulation protein R [Alicyclobacillus cycloheptanicus]WDL99883.1 SpoVR family protein [Alicyclobacillus cycloheptanicus]
MNTADMEELERSIEQMMAIATENGLDYYPMRFEVCPADVLYTFGAYGMPTRFNHWSFGKTFHRMKMEYDLGLSRIYELVINSNPCYAFLLDGNSLLQNKTVCAHVLAHCDFFKNNAMFAGTSRDMVERMASSAERIRQYELAYGRSRVEVVLDAGMALQEHVDASAHGRRGHQVWERERAERTGAWRGQGKRAAVAQRRGRRAGPYDDLWNIGAEASEAERAAESDRDRQNEAQRREGQGLPQRDVMLFLIEHSPALEEWERDILSVLREEMLYFWPQLETKIMNEGWATYWHLRIMREMELDNSEAIEFAKMHAGVVLPSRMSINPYHLGLAIWEDIEKRWNEPTEEERQRFGREPGQGRAKMFEVREMENDVSFLRNYLTKDLIEKLDLYLYQKVGNEWRIVETDWEKVRDSIVASRVNGGIPVIYVEDGDYNQNGELYLKHAYEGVELDLKHLEKVMNYAYQLWGRTCHIQTVVEGRDVLFTCDGKRTTRKFM